TAMRLSTHAGAGTRLHQPQRLLDRALFVRADSEAEMACVNGLLVGCEGDFATGGGHAFNANKDVYRTPPPAPPRFAGRGEEILGMGASLARSHPQTPRRKRRFASTPIPQAPG